MSRAETLPVRPQPTIEYDRSLADPSIPFSVTVNGPEVAELLRTFGKMPDPDIQKLTIRVARKNGSREGSFISGSSHFGTVSENPRKTITLYTDFTWEWYQKSLKVAGEIAQDRKKPKKQFKEFLVTERLPNYLTRAPLKRGLPFADKLLCNAAQRRFNSTLLHEVKHTIDDAEDPLAGRPLHEEAFAFGAPQIAFVAVYGEFIGPQLPQLIDKPLGVWFAGLIGGMVGTCFLTGFAISKLGITLNEFERSANKFARQLENNPRWRSIVTLQAK